MIPASFTALKCGAKQRNTASDISTCCKREEEEMAPYDSEMNQI